MLHGVGGLIAKFPGKFRLPSRTSFANYPLGVSKYFGETIQVSALNSTDFAKKISKYVAADGIAKEKTNPKSLVLDTPLDQSQPTASTSTSAVDELDFALWPLIKSVHIKCLASALENGATLVDLPGTEDSNAARTEVAKRRMEKCSLFWIVDKIQRYGSRWSIRENLGCYTALYSAVGAEATYPTS